MVDEENAFQMVVLVLDARRHQPGHALLMMLAVLVLPVDGDLGGARHLGILFGDRQAALLIDAMFLALVREDGVDKDARIADKRLALFVLDRKSLVRDKSVIVVVERGSRRTL